jgi:hypothetical protein
LLERLAPGTSHGELDIIVVANGCTDDTAEVAGAFGHPVRVLNMPRAIQARGAGGRGRSREDLPARLPGRGRRDRRRRYLGAAPERQLDLTRSARLVRWYYDIWQRLPGVQRGLFGRGVVAVNEAGHQRIAELPPLLADDLAASLSFSQDERSIVRKAHVIVYAPRTVGDLLRRRIRVVTGISQIKRSAGALESSEYTCIRDLFAIIARNPLLTSRMVVFLSVTVLARRQGNRAVQWSDYRTWLRDGSSRD